MLIKSDWTRRRILKTGAVLGAAGVLQPVLKLLESGKTIEAAYPEEMLSIEQYTKGRVKPGMVISKDNAELVKDFCPEGLYVELTRGREIKIQDTTTDVTQFVPDFFVEATLRNKGQAVLDNKNQLWTKDGKPWIGGSPFPSPKNAYEVAWNQIFNVWRVDDFYVPAVQIDLHQGRLVRTERTLFVQIQIVGRLLVDPKPHIPNFTSDLYRQSLWFYHPFDLYGLSLLTIDKYDATQLPEEIVYVPALRRLRRIASEARFEPAWPQGTAWPSEFTILNDPILTSEWKLVGHRPFLYPSPANIGLWAPKSSKDDFTFPYVEDQRWPRTTWELRPEVWIVDGVPHLPGAPISRRRIYVDATVLRSSSGDSWDMSGNIWRSDLFCFGPTNRPGISGAGKTRDSIPLWTTLCFGDVQADTTSNIWMMPDPPDIPSAPRLRANGGFTIDEYFTPDAMLRFAQR